MSWLIESRSSLTMFRRGDADGEKLLVDCRICVLIGASRSGIGLLISSNLCKADSTRATYWRLQDLRTACCLILDSAYH